MATFDVNPHLSFTYRYGENDEKQLVEGQFFSRESGLSIGVSLKVVCKTREEAVDAIQRYAKLIGSEIRA